MEQEKILDRPFEPGRYHYH